MAVAPRREKCLRAAGFRDPFLQVKRRENQAALEHLPALLKCGRYPSPFPLLQLLLVLLPRLY